MRNYSSSTSTRVSFALTILILIISIFIITFCSAQTTDDSINPDFVDDRPMETVTCGETVASLVNDSLKLKIVISNSHHSQQTTTQTCNILVKDSTFSLLFLSRESDLDDRVPLNVTVINCRFVGSNRKITSGAHFEFGNKTSSTTTVSSLLTPTFFHFENVTFDNADIRIINGNQVASPDQKYYYPGIETRPTNRIPSVIVDSCTFFNHVRHARRQYAAINVHNLQHLDSIIIRSCNVSTRVVATFLGFIDETMRGNVTLERNHFTIDSSADSATYGLGLLDFSPKEESMLVEGNSGGHFIINNNTVTNLNCGPFLSRLSILLYRFAFARSIHVHGNTVTFNNCVAGNRFARRCLDISHHQEITEGIFIENNHFFSSAETNNLILIHNVSGRALNNNNNNNNNSNMNNNVSNSSVASRRSILRIRWNFLQIYSELGTAVGGTCIMLSYTSSNDVVNQNTETGSLRNFHLVEVNNNNMSVFSTKTKDPNNNQQFALERYIFRPAALFFAKIKSISKIDVSNNVIHIETLPSFDGDAMLMTTAIISDNSAEMFDIQEAHFTFNRITVKGTTTLTGGMFFMPKAIEPNPMRVINMSSNTVDLKGVFPIENQAEYDVPLIFRSFLPSIAQKVNVLCYGLLGNAKTIILVNNSCEATEIRFEIFKPSLHLVTLLGTFDGSAAQETLIFSKNNFTVFPLGSDAERLRRHRYNQAPGGLENKNPFADKETTLYATVGIFLLVHGPFVTFPASTLRRLEIEDNILNATSAGVSASGIYFGKNPPFVLSSSSSSSPTFLCKNNKLRFEAIVLSPDVTGFPPGAYVAYTPTDYVAKTHPITKFEFLVPYMKRSYPIVQAVVFVGVAAPAASASSSSSSTQEETAAPIIHITQNVIEVSHVLSPSSSSSSSGQGIISWPLNHLDLVNFSMPNSNDYSFAQSILIDSNVIDCRDCAASDWLKMVVLPSPDDGTQTAQEELASPTQVTLRNNEMTIGSSAAIVRSSQPREKTASIVELLIIDHVLKFTKIDVALQGNTIRLAANSFEKSYGAFVAVPIASEISHQSSSSSSVSLATNVNLLQSINVGRSASPPSASDFSCNYIFSEKVSRMSFGIDNNNNNNNNNEQGVFPLSSIITDAGCGYSTPTRTQMIFPTKTKTLYKEPPKPALKRKAQNALVAAGATTSTTVVALSFAAAATPALGFNVGRQMAMIQFLADSADGDCRGLLPPLTDDENDAPSLPMASSPTQMAIGTSRAKNYVGLVFGNFIFVIGVLLVCQILGHLTKRYFTKDLRNWTNVPFVFATSYISLVLFFSCSLLLSPTVSAALVVLAGTSVTDEVPAAMKAGVIIVALIFVVTGFGFIIWAISFRSVRIENFRLQQQTQNNNTSTTTQVTSEGKPSSPASSSEQEQALLDEKKPVGKKIDDKSSKGKKENNNDDVNNNNNNNNNNSTTDDSLEENNNNNGNNQQINASSSRPEDISTLRRLFMYLFVAEGSWQMTKKYTSSIAVVEAEIRNNNNNDNIISTKKQEALTKNKKVYTDYLIAEPSFESFKDTQWFIYVELVSSVCCAFPTFFAQFATSAQASCIVQGSLLLVILLVYVVILLWKNPFKIRIVRWFVPFTAVQQLVMTIIALTVVIIHTNNDNSSSSPNGGDLKTTENNNVSTAVPSPEMQERPGLDSLDWLWDVLFVPLISDSLGGVMATIAAFAPIAKFIKKFVAKLKRAKNQQLEQKLKDEEKKERRRRRDSQQYHRRDSYHHHHEQERRDSRGRERGRGGQDHYSRRRSSATGRHSENDERGRRNSSHHHHYDDIRRHSSSSRGPAGHRNESSGGNGTRRSHQESRRHSSSSPRNRRESSAAADRELERRSSHHHHHHHHHPNKRHSLNDFRYDTNFNDDHDDDAVELLPILQSPAVLSSSSFRSSGRNNRQHVGSHRQSSPSSITNNKMMTSDQRRRESSSRNLSSPNRDRKKVREAAAAAAVVPPPRQSMHSLPKRTTSGGDGEKSRRRGNFAAHELIEL